MTTLLQRIIAILERARIDGGWDDEAIAERIIAETEAFHIEQIAKPPRVESL